MWAPRSWVSFGECRQSVCVWRGVCDTTRPTTLCRPINLPTLASYMAYKNVCVCVAGPQRRTPSTLQPHHSGGLLREARLLLAREGDRAGAEAWAPGAYAAWLPAYLAAMEGRVRTLTAKQQAALLGVWAEAWARVGGWVRAGLVLVLGKDNECRMYVRDDSVLLLCMGGITPHTPQTQPILKQPSQTTTHHKTHVQGHALPRTDATEVAHACLLHALGPGGADWTRGLALLGSLSEPAAYGYAPTLADHAVVLRALARAGRGQEAYELIGRMEARGVRPDIACLNYALRACGRLRMSRECGELMGMVLAAQERAKGGVGEGQGEVVVREALQSLGAEEGAMATEKAGRPRSAHTYSLAIDAAAKAGNVHVAVGWLEEMKVGRG